MPIGIGYDIHALVKQRALYLGGVRIPSMVGLKGHSDADVLLHALCDAMLGAAGLGDIGEHFPDTDPAYKNISSLRLLEAVNGMIRKKRYRAAQVDTIIFSQNIKITPFKEKIRAGISRALGLPSTAVNIKAKTMEGFDAVGANKAISAWCAVILKKTRIDAEQARIRPNKKDKRRKKIAAE